MHVLDVNQMIQSFVKSLELVVFFATFCAALELTFPAYRYSFASYVRGVRNWIIRLGWGALVWHLFAVSLGWLGIEPLVTINFGTLLHSDNAIINNGLAVLSGVLVVSG